MAMARADRRLGEIFIKFANSQNLERAIRSMGIKAGRSFPEIFKTANDDSYEDKKQNLRKLLDELITIDNLKNSKMISNYIQTYNEHCTSKMHISMNGKKIENRFFYQNTKKIKYDDLLVFSIIRFLKNFKVNKQYLHHCQFRGCERYFLSKQKGPRVKNCPECRYKSSYTPEQLVEYRKDKKKNDARSQVKSYIIELSKQGSKLEDIKFRCDDDEKLKKMITNSNWSVDLAYEAAMKELKKGKLRKST